jgi:hypothetical protein
MTTHLTEIDWSGKYMRKFAPGATITNPDGSILIQDGDQWAAIDHRGRIVTDLGAVVLFDNVASANEFLEQRKGKR